MINPEMELAAHPEFQRKSPVAEGLLGFRRAASGTRDLIRIKMNAVTAGLPPQGKGKPISRINREKLRETMVNNGGLYRAIQRNRTRSHAGIQVGTDEGLRVLLWSSAVQ